MNVFLFVVPLKTCETNHEHGGSLSGAAGMATDVIGAAVGFVGSNTHGH